jgi:DNA-binding CsgD family transcriptional regulator
MKGATMSEAPDNLCDPSLIERLYYGALSDEGWPETLTAFADAIDANGTHVLAISDDLSNIPFQRVGRVDPEATRDYETNYFSLDFRIPRLLKHPPGTVYVDRDLGTDDELRTSPFHREFLPRYRCERVMVVQRPLVGRLKGVMAAARRHREGDFNAQQQRIFSAYSVHLARAMQISLRLVEFGKINTALETLLDDFTFGIVLLDKKKRVLHANSCAKTILDNKSPLLLDDARLTHRNPVQHEMLEQRIDIATSSPLSAAADTSVLSITTDDGHNRIEIAVMPLRASMFAGIDNSAAVVVYLLHSGHRRQSVRKLLQHKFGLSAAETRCAELLREGHSLEHIAKRLNVSINTIRTQIQALFQKTDTKRQAELVAVLNRDIAALMPFLAG